MTTVLVTGANRGIGLEICRIYRQRGARVIGVCRQASEALKALGADIMDGVDVADLATLYALKQRLGDTGLDILINNAGVFHLETLDLMDWDALQRQLEVNAVGPLRVTHCLLDHMRDGGKIAFVSSRMGSMADNDSGGYYGYRMSKAALNAAGRSLAIDLRPRGIAVALLHPGYVKTDMTRHQGTVTPDVAAAGLVARIDQLTLDTSGQFWHANGQRLEW